jgi:hypothetical protein
MRLPHGWKATFIDADQRIVLTKPGQNSIRRIYLSYRGQVGTQGLLKRVDAQGNISNDNINPIAPETRAQLVTVCRERWA